MFNLLLFTYLFACGDKDADSATVESEESTEDTSSEDTSSEEVESE